MKAELKAKEIYKKYIDAIYIDASLDDTVESANKKITQHHLDCKQCALICVDEIMKYNDIYAENQHLTNWGNYQKYWQEVKEHINKL